MKQGSEAKSRKEVKEVKELHPKTKEGREEGGEVKEGSDGRKRSAAKQSQGRK